jgi:hypothetical protein
MGGNTVFEMIPFPSRFSGGWEGARFNRIDFISKAVSVGGGEGTGLSKQFHVRVTSWGRWEAGEG